MSYEFKQQDVFDFANTFNTPKKQRGNELFFERCPYCNGGEHDKNTFSINLENGTFKCFRASCDKHGHFVELARDFQFQLDFGEIKEYRKISQKPIVTRPKAVEYLERRGISKAVAERYGITTRTDNDNILVFPFQDENNVRQFVKYRNTKYNGKGNKEWCERDTKPILFGMAQCENFETLVITEGQIDSLSLAECGITNAVSVPTGAVGFTWYRHVQEWIEKFKDVIVFGDCEKGRITLVEELQNRLPQKVKVVQLQDYLGEKDANAILQKYGKQAVIKAVENAKVPVIKNIKELSEVTAIDINSLPKIKTNIRAIDRVIGGLIFGQVVLLTGKRGNGKSTLLSQFVANALDQEQSAFIYSGELADYHFKRWLDYQIAGPGNIIENKNEYGDSVYTLAKATVAKINSWYKGRAYIYDNNYVPEGEQELESLTKTIEKAIKQYDTKLICIDNLMTAMDVVDDQGNLYLAQSNFVGNLKKIAIKYNVVIVLVAHPRKSKDDFTNDDVSGSSDITNKVDVVMSYNRTENDLDFPAKLLITKNRLTGKLALKDKAIGLFYSESSKRITCKDDDAKKCYGWEVTTKVEGFTQVQMIDEDCPF